MGTFGEDVAKALMSAGKTLHREHKQRERDARATDRRSNYRPEREATLKETVFSVIDEAMAAASGNGTYNVPARTLYYKVRPLIQDYTDRELQYSYFSQTLLVEYQEEFGPLVGLVRDPRGNLREPHTGNTLPLGTTAVAQYTFPAYVFDKILYVEKEGLDPIWEDARIAERYDMAIAAGKGQPAEAVRELFERAEAGGDYKLFVLHDADPAGYSIARTMAEETRRMPNHNVAVIDLGLTVADAIAMDLPTEDFTRRKALPHWMDERLTPTEREWFHGTPSYGVRHQWECTRVELNALSAPDLVAYVEAGLALNDADGKVVPPDDVLDDEATSALEDVIGWNVDEFITEMLDIDAIKATIYDEFREEITAGPAAMVADRFEEDRSQSWRRAVKSSVTQRSVDRSPERLARITELLLQAARDAS